MLGGRSAIGAIARGRRRTGLSLLGGSGAARGGGGDGDKVTEHGDAASEEVILEEKKHDWRKGNLEEAHDRGEG